MQARVCFCLRVFTEDTYYECLELSIEQTEHPHATYDMPPTTATPDIRTQTNTDTTNTPSIISLLIGCVYRKLLTDAVDTHIRYYAMQINETIISYM